VHSRNLAALGHDLLAAALAWWVAYALRFNLEIPHFYFLAMLRTLGPVLVVQAASFLLFGLYRGVWRYSSVRDLQRILLAAGVAALAVPAAALVLEARGLVPRSVLVLDPILLVVLMGGSRFAYRAWKEHRLYGRAWLRGEAVVILGAGQAGAALARDLQRSERYRAVALFDDDPKLAGQRVHGVRVAGSIAQLPDYASRTAVSRAIVAMPSAAAAARRRAVETAQQAGLQVLTVPGLEDLVSGRIAISQVRRVELEDLLGREEVALDNAGLGRLIGGRRGVVTGAGGSIGAELCRQIARHAPAQLVLFEANEFALYTITEEFRAPGHPPVVPLIADIRDAARTRSIFAAYRPHMVFHAAAYKHVPLMEEANAWQAVRNNVLGTAHVAGAAQAFGVEEFVMISTDKAVNPTNVMGATKRLAERVCRAMAPEAGRAAPACRFVTVRFGNVLGSAGSVIPKFRQQIAAGGPVTVTDPQIERFFMSIPEAAQLVLQAGLMGEGGEIFVLDMGEPVRIADLARDMIRLSGFTEEEIRIEYTGLRPGEKLYEELLADDENLVGTAHAKIRIARQRTQDDAAWRTRLIAEIESAGEPDDPAVRGWLAGWVPEYRPEAGGPGPVGAPAGPVQRP
jgi:FlaA1/EpsC-like NDP-sugar epimerase